MKKKVTTKARKKASKPKSALQKEVAEALQVTWLLKGRLKNAQMAYLKTGALLAQVRDKKLFTVLHHEDMENYAEERLNLGRSALYKYLQVYDWALEYHPAWLQPKPAGFIPVLSDATDLMWIERKLKEKDLHPETRTRLEEMRAKGLEGKLRKRDMDGFRKQSKPSSDVRKAYLAQLRAMRRRGAILKDIPAETISKLDAAIEVLENAIATDKTGMDLSGAA